MAVIVHNTSYKIDCPWLLDREQLLELDRIIEQQWESLLKYRENKIEEQVEVEAKKNDKKTREKIRQDIEYYHEYNFLKSKNLTLFNSDETQIKTSSFSSVLQNPDIENRTVKGFRYRIKCAGIECELFLSPYNSNITLDVSPGTIEEARSLFVSLKGWINRAKSPLWQRIARGCFFGMWWLILFFTLMISFQIFEEKIMPDWQQIKHAHYLLEKGIDNNDVSDALATMLAIVSEYEKPKSYTIFSFPSWYICLLIAFSFLCFILTFLPKTVIGIGKGEETIIWWRRWLHLISYTIPILILSSFVWPKITDWIKSFL
jgi:hypothetical protein